MIIEFLEHSLLTKRIISTDRFEFPQSHPPFAIPRQSLVPKLTLWSVSHSHNNFESWKAKDTLSTIKSIQVGVGAAVSRAADVVMPRKESKSCSSLPRVG